MASEKEVRAVKNRHAPRLLSQPGVVGVGVEKDDTGDYVLTIHLDTDDPEVRKQLPDQIEGCRVRFVKSGPFRKFSSQS
jgi:hypothetical protein